MELKNFVDHYYPMTCILSVEKKPNGGYGKIRMEAGNDVYIESIGLAKGNRKVKGNGSSGFVPGSEYERYIPKDQNFENVIYRCAVLKQPIHEFINADRYNFGIEVFLIPLEFESEEICYCSYTQVLIPKASEVLVSSKISPETALDVLKTVIKLRGAVDFEQVMQEIIEDIRSSCDAELCCILLLEETKRSCTVLCEAKKEGSKLEDVSKIADEDFYSLTETWMDTLDGSYCLFLQNKREMEYLKEKNPEWYDSLKDSVDSLVLFPMNSRGRFYGYIWAVNFSKDNGQQLKDTLETLNYFISSEIASYQLVKRLRIMGMTDELTGVLNRNEMNLRVKELCEHKSDLHKDYGIVFADMNGLKYVNDHLGHDAGDDLLKNSAMILKSAFPGDEVYRAGGDEFLVLMENTTQEEMEGKIQDIKEKSCMFENVSFAVGSCLCHQGEDIRELLKKADALMYEDKRNYYADHPEKSRD